MKTGRKLFQSFPSPTREEWVRLAGTDYSAELEPGLAVPALLARPVESDESIDRSILLNRDSRYHGPLAVRTDSIEIPEPEFAAHSGFSQVGLQNVVDIASIKPLSVLFGLHLTTADLDSNTISVAAQLANEKAIGSLASSDPDQVLALFARDSPVMSATLRDKVWIAQNGFRLLGIDLTGMEDERNSAIGRSAFACAWIKHLVHVGAASGLKPDVIANHLHFAFPLSNSFWLEIAFLRAVRVLIDHTLRRCGASKPPPALITAVVGPGPSSAVESGAESALIRYSAIASAAMIGGADMVAGRGVEVVSGADDLENQRLLASTQLALIHESRLTERPDPAGGGYYVEELSKRIATSAWDLYCAREDEWLLATPSNAFANEGRSNK